MKKTVIAALAALSMAGCASNPQRQAMLAEYEASRPTCQGKEQCDAMWEHAQVWVANNSRMKIQTATNVLIETYGGGSNSAQLAMRVVKEPLGGGAYKLVFSGGCANIFGCVPDAVETGMAFNRYINAAAE